MIQDLKLNLTQSHLDKTAMSADADFSVKLVNMNPTFLVVVNVQIVPVTIPRHEVRFQHNLLNEVFDLNFYAEVIVGT